MEHCKTIQILQAIVPYASYISATTYIMEQWLGVFAWGFFIVGLVFSSLQKVRALKPGMLQWSQQEAASHKRQD